MKIRLLVIGKTDDKNLNQLIENYQKRLQHYIGFQLEVIHDIKNVKNLSEIQQKEKEGELILAKLKNTDQLVLVIGGPYGFSETVYKKAMGKISLSKMTFSHQMIRLFIVEQLYRGFTILKNEPYHHE